MDKEPIVRVEAARCCRVVVRGSDQFVVLEALAGWANKNRHSGINIMALQWSTEWVPDPDAAVPGDETREYTIVMPFMTETQHDTTWEEPCH